MKFVLIIVFGLLLAIAIPVLVVTLINRKHRLKTYVKAIMIPISSIVLITSFTLLYFAFNYHAKDEAKSYLKSDDDVAFVEERDWYCFDHRSSDGNAVIFYAGAKVDPLAYSPLCSKLAHQGVDVYMIKSPLYFPLLSVNAADGVVTLNKYPNLYLMGHSLGGTVASLYLSSHDDDVFKGIIFLASYPNKELKDSLRCLSLYGTNDKVLSQEEYQKNKNNFPSATKEIVLEGGNHACFGDYGAQRGDGVASISQEKQTDIVVNAAIGLIMNA